MHSASGIHCFIPNTKHSCMNTICIAKHRRGVWEVEQQPVLVEMLRSGCVGQATTNIDIDEILQYETALSAEHEKAACTCSLHSTKSLLADCQSGQILDGHSMHSIWLRS
uniref:Uncharacterized protein n=1 Tax=Eutreptiella gymnastica TaxID=73025 RepID=A0A7S4FQE5_9EUGL